jgi:hypothetical protein
MNARKALQMNQLKKKTLMMECWKGVKRNTTTNHGFLWGSNWLACHFD